MRLRIFGRIIYVKKGLAAVILVAIAIAAALIIHNCENRRGLPEIEKHSSPYSENGTHLTTPNGGEKKTNGAEIKGTGIDVFATPATPQPTEDRTVAVHITGAVEREGVYRLEYGSIIQDAVDMCGGLLPDADTYFINLAMKLNDGMRIHIPFVYSEDKTWLLDVGYASGTGPSGSEQSTGRQNGLVNINTASVNELITLNGIGESTARDIIAYREEHGRFETIEEIMNVPGIKAARFGKIKNFITVSG